MKITIKNEPKSVPKEEEIEVWLEYYENGYVTMKSQRVGESNIYFEGNFTPDGRKNFIGGGNFRAE
jgi:hypothetical protein